MSGPSHLMHIPASLNSMLVRLETLSLSSGALPAGSNSFFFTPDNVKDLQGVAGRDDILLKGGNAYQTTQFIPEWCDSPLVDEGGAITVVFKPCAPAYNVTHESEHASGMSGNQGEVVVDDNTSYSHDTNRFGR